MCKDIVAGNGAAHVKVSLPRWYISRSMVSEWIDRQAHVILKVFSALGGPGSRLSIHASPYFVRVNPGYFSENSARHPHPPQLVPTLLNYNQNILEYAQGTEDLGIPIV